MGSGSTGANDRMSVRPLPAGFPSGRLGRVVRSQLVRVAKSVSVRPSDGETRCSKQGRSCCAATHRRSTVPISSSTQMNGRPSARSTRGGSSSAGPADPPRWLRATPPQAAGAVRSLGPPTRSPPPSTRGPHQIASERHQTWAHSRVEPLQQWVPPVGECFGAGVGGTGRVGDGPNGIRGPSTSRKRRGRSISSWVLLSALSETVGAVPGSAVNRPVGLVNRSIRQAQGRSCVLAVPAGRGSPYDVYAEGLPDRVGSPVLRGRLGQDQVPGGGAWFPPGRVR